MIANFFNKAKPIDSVILIIMLLVLYFLSQYEIQIHSYSFSFFVQRISEVLLIITLFFIFNFIIVKNKLTLTNNFALLFICLGFAVFYPLLSMPKLLLSQLFLALAFRRIYSLRTSMAASQKVFDSAFLIAVSSFFYFENSFFLLLLFIALLVFQKTNWRYFVIVIIGFVLPYFLVYVYALAFNSFSFFNSLVNVKLIFNTALIKHVAYFITADVIFLTGCLAFIVKTIKTSEFSNEFRSLWSLVLAHFILATVLIFTGKTFSLEKTVYIIFPYGVIMANYIQTIQKNGFKESVVYLFIGATLASVFYNFVP